MNILKRAITSQVSLSSHPSRKWRCLLYSTTYTLNPPKPRKRSQMPPPPPPPPTSWNFSQGVKDETEKLTDWPRPSEIPYQAKVANLVNLIGHIRTPVKFQTSPNGKYWAATVIYQEQDLLIPVLFEGDLAHVVTCHVKENDCVYVIGRLSEEPMPFVLSETSGNFHLRVQNINFVQGFEKNAFEQRSRKKFGGDLFSGSSDIVMPLKEEDKGDFLSKEGLGASILSADRENIQTSLNSADTNKGEDSVLDSWRDLVQNSRQWRDYREHKSKGLVANKYPDFKHKDTGAGLWLRTAPKWVLGGLQSLDFDVPPSEQPSKQKQAKDAKEELWRSLAENQNQWWDNRLNKKNPKAPDFKHKQSGEVLWLNSAPNWVLSKLPPTGEK